MFLNNNNMLLICGYPECGFGHRKMDFRDIMVIPASINYFHVRKRSIDNWYVALVVGCVCLSARVCLRPVNISCPQRRDIDMA